MQHLTPRRLFLTAATTLAVLTAGPTTAQACPPGAAGPAGAATVEKVEKVQKAEKAGKVEKVEKVEKVGKAAGVQDIGPGEHGRHRLTITVSGTGGAGDGTYTLRCAPDGGSHASPGAACERLDQLAAEGLDPFKAVPRGTMCTQQYGGPQTARVRGEWQGRHIDAAFSRTDGCEISRWNSLVPVLPSDGA
ncbi:SSI family serine proteinase inhibitor [Streptomyces aureocirculatus]|uniref:SSI family serine proteinase inhibitor n=1 Tax=Streptomyces aureocirculatus TaxID=67275 RepID=UPI0004C928D4|nr:SSI family serine proteinase inhibitor [Streptomyces aureocirculatus]